MHEIIVPSFDRVDERGTFREVLNRGPWETLIWGRMNRDAVMGQHYHKRTQVFIFLTSGSARIRTIHVETGSKDAFTLHENQGVLLRVNESHSIRFLRDSSFIMLKSQRYNPADPDTFAFPVPE